MRSLFKRTGARRFAVVLALALASVAVAACGSGDSGDDSGGGGGGDKASDPIKIGAVLAQSGLFSQFDVSNTLGVQIATEHVNADGGVLGSDLDLTVGDSKSDPPLGGSVARKLINDGSKYIITSADFDFGSPAALAAQSQGVPAMSAGAEVPEFGIAGIGNFAFTMGTATAETAASWAEWMHDEKDMATVYMLEDPTIAYDTSLCSNFESAWNGIADADSILGKDQFKNSDASIDAQISRIKSLPAPPDFIVLCSYPPGGATAVRQLRAAGIDQPIIAGTAFSGSAWLDAVGKLSDFYYTDYISVYGDDPNPEVNKLVAEAKKRADDPNSIVGVIASAYSAVQAFKQAAEANDSTEPDDLVTAFESFDDEKLLVGPTTFTAEQHITTTRPVTILEIQNGKGKFVQQYTPKSVPTLETK